MSKALKTTADQIDRMRTLRRQGFSLAEIAREVGRCPDTVLRHVGDIPSRNVAPAEKPERNAEIVAAYRSGESQSSIAARYGITQKRVSQINASALKREALALAKAAEATQNRRSRLGNPTSLEVEALYFAGGEQQVRERWPNVSAEFLGALLTEKRIEKIVELRALGWDDGKIGIELGLTIEGVQKHVPTPATAIEQPEVKTKRRKRHGKPAKPVTAQATVPVFDDDQMIPEFLRPIGRCSLQAGQSLDDDYLPEPASLPRPWLARAGAAIGRFIGFGRS